MYRYGLMTTVLLLTACAGSQSGPYVLPGYYQPAQAQSPYIAAGYNDDMGNYHPPTEQPGGVVYGRWYRPQPGNPTKIEPAPTPNAMHLRDNPQTNYYSEISNMSSDGDDATAFTPPTPQVPYRKQPTKPYVETITYQEPALTPRRVEILMDK